MSDFDLAGPLTGVRVLDLSWVGPGSVATWLLADLGAEVVKVEPVDGSDVLRTLGPFVGGRSVAHLALDRRKQSLAVDVRESRGRRALLAVARGADAAVVGFRPGVAERLGVGAEQLRAASPRITYCAMTGFGTGGPLATVAAHDVNYMARSGALALADVPAPLPVQVADYLGAAVAALGVVSGVLQARATGRGADLEAGLFDAALFAVMLPLAQRLLVGAEPTPGGTMLTGGLAAYGVYACRDGGLLTVGALEPKFWRRFCAVTGLGDEAETDHHDPAVQDGLRSAIAEALATRDRDDWLRAFDGEDACVAPVLGLGEALEQPQVRERDALEPLATGGAAPAGPLRVARHEGRLPAAAPEHGEHTAALLRRAGLSDDEIAALAADGVVAVR